MRGIFIILTRIGGDYCFKLVAIIWFSFLLTFYFGFYWAATKDTRKFSNKFTLNISVSWKMNLVWEAVGLFYYLRCGVLNIRKFFFHYLQNETERSEKRKAYKSAFGNILKACILWLRVFTPVCPPEPR